MISAISKSISASQFGGIARLASSFANVNQVELLGKVGWKPSELSFASDKEKKFVKFSVVTSNVSYSKQGDAKPVYTYHSIAVFNPKLFSVAEAIAKDSTVYVKGCLSYYTSKDKEGNKIRRCSVVADNIVPQVSVVQREDNKAEFLQGSKTTSTVQEKSEVASEEVETVKFRTVKVKKASRKTPPLPKVTNQEDEAAKAAEEEEEGETNWRCPTRACAECA